MRTNNPITVLMYEDTLPHMNNFRCVNCSRTLCKIDSDVKSLVFSDGYDPEQHHELVSNMHVLEVKCRGCDCVYKFMYQKGK